MFYLINNNEITEINPEKIYTICPNCGTPFKVDLEDIIRNDGDLLSTQVFCEECSKNK